jgi:hypothetical protein
MSAKRSRTAESETPRRANDLIAEEHSTGQAHTPAAKTSRSSQKGEKPLVEPPSEGHKTATTVVPTTPLEDLEIVPRQRSALFTLKLEIQPDGSVERTIAKYARAEESDEKPEQWPGWDVARLVSFIEQRAGIQGLQDAAGTENIAGMLIETEPEPIVAEFSGEPALRELEVVPIGEERSHLILSQRQPFHVRLTLDLAEVVMPEGQPISYSAAVLAKRMGGGTPEKLGETRGELAQRDSLTLDIPGSELPEGLYRLEALVDLGLVAETAEPQHTLKAQLQGGLLQIY